MRGGGLEYRKGLDFARPFSSENENWMIEFSSVEAGPPRLRGIIKPVYMPFLGDG